MKAVASMVTTGGILADIGTDHAYVPIALVQRQKIKGAIAMDINEGPLARAQEHIRAARLEEYIQTRLSDGAEALLPNEADSILIAGMGGETDSPQNPAGLLQLRRVYSRRRRTYRVADQSGVPRPEHVEPAVIHTRQLDARGAGPARTRRFVRLHPDDVQRGGTRRLHVRQDRQGAPSADSRGAAHLLLERHLPPHRGAGPFGTRLHLRLARQHRPDHGSNT